MRTNPPSRWLRPTRQGIYVEPGGFFIDPTAAVERAVVTHGHSDHARPGHAKVLATAATLAVMAARYGAGFAGERQALRYGEPLTIGDVSVRLVPAGHILGSAQVVLEHGGWRVVVSGDFKRRNDDTCASFEPAACDVFVTEATFGLPVFRHPDPAAEIARLLASVRRSPERAHVVGAYALGKCQRMIALLRRAGWTDPIYVHGALLPLCALYEELGVRLGAVVPAAAVPKSALRGQIVLAPPSALTDRWANALPDPVTALASGWMRIKQRAKQRGVEIPLVISDHADWDELTATMVETGAAEIWVTHGQEDALVHYAGTRGLTARALALVGFEEESA